MKTDNTYKARLVAQGWNQVPGRDCGGTYTPVCRLQSNRMVLVIAAELNLEVSQLDVKSASLYADIEEEVFVKTAHGFCDEAGKESLRTCAKPSKLVEND